MDTQDLRSATVLLELTWLTFRQFGNFLYDNTEFSKDDLSKTYLDLLDPKWRGKLVLTIPNDDDAVGYLFSLIVGRYGWEWLEGLKANDVQWVRGTATTAYIMAESIDPGKAGSKRPKEYVSDNGERRLPFTTAGYPVSSSELSWQATDTSERFMSWSQAAYIMKYTPRPETAKLFIAYFCSEEFQSLLSAEGSKPTMLRSLKSKNGVASHDDHPSTNMNGFRIYDLDLEFYDFDDPRAL